jgi:hypothetical protein
MRDTSLFAATTATILHVAENKLLKRKLESLRKSEALG